MEGSDLVMNTLQAFKNALDDYLQKQCILSSREQRELGSIRRMTLKYKKTPNNAGYKRIAEKAKKKNRYPETGIG